MATYNFTVRAVDNTGAFADRNFQMNVNNTQIDRFIMLGATGLARSVDGVTWNQDPGITGSTLGFENNQWIISSSDRYASTPYIYTSLDGLNWNRIVPSYTTPTGTGTVSSSSINRIKWRNGSYYGYLTIKNTTPLISVYEFKSADLKTWVPAVSTNTSSLFNFAAGSQTTVAGLVDWDYDPTTDTTIALFSQQANASVSLLRRTGNNPWVGVANVARITQGITLYSGQAVSSSFGLGTVTLIGGVWMVNWGGAGIYTSVNGIDWVFRDTSTVLGNATTAGPIYSNGRLLLHPMSSAISSFEVLAASIDAGRSWPARSTYSATTGGGLTPYNYLRIFQQVMAAYNGTIVIINPSNAGFIVSRDDGLTWSGLTVNTVAPLIGVPTAIASRNT